MHKNRILYILTIFVLILLFSIFNNQIWQNIKNKISALMNLNVLYVYDYQKSGGLKREIKIGDKGPDVKNIQHALSEFDKNFKNDHVTGYFGPITSEAISNFQKNNNLKQTGIVDYSTLNLLNKIYFNELCPQEIGTGPILSDEILFLVNKKNPLPKNYIPKNLEKLPESIKTVGLVCVKSNIIPHLEKMILDAKKDGFEIAVTSGFRRLEIQDLIYKIWSNVLGSKRVVDEVALPGHSEHQLGTAIDVSAKSNNFIGADDLFYKTPEFNWLEKNAHKYGFILSYPKDKTEITGYIYEPWHWRFVGIEHAKNIHNKRITLEEYLVFKK
ncbi:MAG TPA: D-alanyl-D-alanine carboxypeptidase family protein [Candidatus Paceibacterota bacterium]|mgnify:CR=1 FL=1|nr:D-alanyl-D-alanine carboxypeptidase family protein [Candidatus Paceibacterota bacterium]HMP19232.1 D-alanyl-D-alanine carboxypeptidase family protein [Candidatus Paceibacterota bacterium]HMP85508.1 D-alanyl-D-alanine carboxypeptidase family protein [Candidatus Paceibacterota bacterium]